LTFRHNYHLQLVRSRQVKTTEALVDLVNGARLWRLWVMLGWLDIRQRYRRAIIGPFWISISMAIMVGALGVLYSSLFKLNIAEFIPFLTAGFAAWLFISTTISEGTAIFLQAEAMIRNTNLPISIHIYRLIWRNLIAFGHNAVVMLAIYYYFKLNPGVHFLFVVPTLVVVMINLVATTLLIGLVCARFRDASPIVLNLLQIAFFITPILYNPSLLKGNLIAFAKWNPFYYTLEILRSPLLGSIPNSETMLTVLGISCANLAVCFLFYSRFRSRLAFWL
jgi:ABC-2 type transport system permease protein/lipopolysaccharide transport system permease protein